MIIRKFELTEDQKRELIDFCGTEAKADLLIPYLAECFEEEQIGKMGFSNIQPPAASQERAESILSHLQKIDSLVDELGENELLLEQHYMLANKRSTPFPDELNIFLNSYLRNGRSGFSILLERMINAVESYKAELPEPQRGQKLNRNYSPMLLPLATGFEQIFPNNNISRNHNSIFFKVCRWFLTNFTDWEGTYQVPKNADPAGTIQKLIDYRKLQGDGNK